MSRCYNEIMEKIEVSKAMSERILANIDAMDLTGRPQKQTPSMIRKYVSLAACFLLVAVGVFSILRFLPGQPPPVQVVPDIVKCESADALSKIVGFSVDEVAELPFEPTSISYVAYWKSLAQITYQNDSKSAVFRKSSGDEDNSGDYSEYSGIATVIVNNTQVTLKGNGSTYSLAIWTDGTYSYSLKTSMELTKDKWEDIIQRMK